MLIWIPLFALLMLILLQASHLRTQKYKHGME
jgi:hypothetical protein